MTACARISLSLVPQKLAKRTGQTGLSYRRLYNGVLDGTVPAERGANGRWYVAEEDLDAIAAAFGLTPKAPAPAVAA